MDLEETKGMPEFEHDIDSYTYSNIPEQYRALAETISKLRQEVRWLAEKTVIAHNLAVQTSVLAKRVAVGAGGVVGTYLMAKLMEMLFLK